MSGLQGVPPEVRKKLKEAVRKLRQKKAALRRAEAKAKADKRATAGAADSAAIQEQRHVERHPDVNVRRGS